MVVIEAAKFETKCRQLIDDVIRTGSPLTITKAGEMVAQLVFTWHKARKLMGLH